MNRFQQFKKMRDSRMMGNGPTRKRYEAGVITWMSRKTYFSYAN